MLAATSAQQAGDDAIIYKRFSEDNPLAAGVHACVRFYYFVGGTGSGELSFLTFNGTVTSSMIPTQSAGKNQSINEI